VSFAAGHVIGTTLELTDGSADDVELPGVRAFDELLATSAGTDTGRREEESATDATEDDMLMDMDTDPEAMDDNTEEMLAVTDELAIVEEPAITDGLAAADELCTADALALPDELTMIEGSAVPEELATATAEEVPLWEGEALDDTIEGTVDEDGRPELADVEGDDAVFIKEEVVPAMLEGSRDMIPITRDVS